MYGISIGYLMRDKAISVLSLEGRYHHLCFIILFGSEFLQRDKKRYRGTYRFYFTCLSPYQPDNGASV